MRTVSFSVLGGVDGETETRGTATDLPASIPYVLSAGLVPPLRVVNDLFRKGLHDAGMSGGCTWEPFEITQSEWAALANDLEARAPGERCEVVEPPEWVRTIEDWHAWILMFKHGYPEEFRHLDQESRSLERASAQAKKDGNTDLAEALHERAIEADRQLVELVMEHRKRMDPQK